MPSASLPPAMVFAVLTVLVPLTQAAAEGRVRLAQAPASEPGQPGQRADTRAIAPRPRARILVQPRYPYRRYHSIYPLPYPIEYPGPYAVRHCTNRYVVEWRPSGEVVVPRMRCWWAPR